MSRRHKASKQKRIRHFQAIFEFPDAIEMPSFSDVLIHEWGSLICIVPRRPDVEELILPSVTESWERDWKQLSNELENVLRRHEQQIGKGKG